MYFHWPQHGFKDIARYYYLWEFDCSHRVHIISMKQTIMMNDKWQQSRQRYILNYFQLFIISLTQFIYIYTSYLWQWDLSFFRDGHFKKASTSTYSNNTYFICSSPPSTPATRLFHTCTSWLNSIFQVVLLSHWTPWFHSHTLTSPIFHFTSSIYVQPSYYTAFLFHPFHNFAPFA